jgi:voltage-gated potassium channel
MASLRSAASEATLEADGHDRRRGSWRAPLLAGLRGIVVVGVLLLAYSLAPWDRWDSLSVAWQLAVWFLVLAAVVAWQIRAVMRSTRPWLRAVPGAALSVALLLLPFAAAYAGMSQSSPASFTQPLDRVDSLYFAVTVFSTVGFGDIAAVSRAARLLVTVQMLADLVLIGVIVKVLVGAAQRRRRSLGPRGGRGGGGQEAERTG